ncbi:MAG: 1,2-phenylacetyl-CoA epoxidase subunit PaaD [Acidimicrobiia bacterium]|nr:1,2-phenylacetyl-CoA epoxidase subunit PaaD [Acidimicrobiia bacterium]
MSTAILERARSALATVTDPEIPVLTIDDLGILRDIETEGSTVTVTITPTYSGCPAMDVIKDEIRTALEAAGFEEIEVRTVYSPAWTTDWMSPAGRRKLEEFGIAAPHPASISPRPAVLCVRCRGEARTVSEFGSTACKALMVCTRCGEPFDYFKEL